MTCGKELEHVAMATFNYPNDDAIQPSAEALAKKLAAYPKLEFHLVVHSMGGLVARCMLENKKLDPGNVKTLIMLGTPNHGSQVSDLRSALELVQVADKLIMGQKDIHEALLSTLVDGFGEAGYDLRPNSPLLLRLNQQPRNNKVKYHLVLGNRAPLAAAQVETLGQNILAFVDKTPGAQIYRQRLARFLGDLDELVMGKGDGAVSLKRGKLQGVEAKVVEQDHLGLLKTGSDTSPAPAYAAVKLWLQEACAPLGSLRGTTKRGH